jgi:DNA-binding transcriptional LysR family regulator
VEIQQLRYFVAVADELHFGRAAERLHVTPSPLSRRIRELEREVGGELLTRGYHDVQLTDLGRSFLERARDVLERFDDLQSYARAQRATEHRRLPIGASPLTPPRALDFVLETLTELDPDLAVPVTLEPSAGLIRRLCAGELELAVVHLPVEETGVATMPVTEYRFAVVLRADDPLAGRSSLSLPDLRDHTFVTGSSKVHPAAMNRLRQFITSRGVHHVVELDSQDPVAMSAHIARTHAFSLTVDDDAMPGRRVWDEPRFAVVPLDEPDLHFQVGLAWRSARAAEDPLLHDAVSALQARLGVEPALG